MHPLHNFQSPSIDKSRPKRAIDFLTKKEIITTRDQFTAFNLSKEASDALNFFDVNKIFEWIAYFNELISDKRHHILFCPIKKGQGVAMNDGPKMEIQIMFNGKYQTWSSIKELFHLCNYKDLSSSNSLPQGSLAIDSQTHFLFNGGYTYRGLRIDRKRPKGAATKADLLTHLRELNSKDDDSLLDYLENLIVFQKRNSIDRDQQWKCEVITYSDPAGGIDGSHSSMRLISPWGHVISAGWWRYDDLSAKKNQRGIYHSPDRIELKLGRQSAKGESGPNRIFAGDLETDSALKMLAEILFLHRYPGQDHFYSICDLSRGEESSKKTGKNCADIVLKLMQICLPSLNRDHCLVTANNYLALSLVPKNWEELPMMKQLFQRQFLPLINRSGGYFLNLLAIRSQNLDGMTDQLAKEGGEALIKCPADFSKNLIMTLPELISEELRRYIEITQEASLRDPRDRLYRLIEIKYQSNKTRILS